MGKNSANITFKRILILGVVPGRIVRVLGKFLNEPVNMGPILKNSNEM